MLALAQMSTSVQCLFFAIAFALMVADCIKVANRRLVTASWAVFMFIFVYATLATI